MLAEIIFIIFYIGIVIGSYYLFAHFVKKEIKVEKLGNTTRFVTFLAALSMPSSLLFLIKGIFLAITIWTLP